MGKEMELRCFVTRDAIGEKLFSRRFQLTKTLYLVQLEVNSLICV